MDIDIQELDEIIKIAVTGSIEIITLKPLKEKLLEIGTNSDKNVEIDLSKVDYMDSSGMGVLLTLSKMLKRKGKALKITNPSDRIKKILQLSSLQEIM